MSFRPYTFKPEAPTWTGRKRCTLEQVRDFAIAYTEGAATVEIILARPVRAVRVTRLRDRVTIRMDTRTLRAILDVAEDLMRPSRKPKRRR